MPDDATTRDYFNGEACLTNLIVASLFVPVSAVNFEKAVVGKKTSNAILPVTLAGPPLNHRPLMEGKIDQEPTNIGSDVGGMQLIRGNQCHLFGKNELCALPYVIGKPPSDVDSSKMKIVPSFHSFPDEGASVVATPLDLADAMDTYSLLSVSKTRRYLESRKETYS